MQEKSEERLLGVGIAVVLIVLVVLALYIFVIRPGMSGPSQGTGSSTQQPATLQQTGQAVNKAAPTPVSSSTPNPAEQVSAQAVAQAQAQQSSTTTSQSSLEAIQAAEAAQTQK